MITGAHDGEGFVHGIFIQNTGLEVPQCALAAPRAFSGPF